MVERDRTLVRILVTISSGIIVANFAISSSPTLRNFAPLSMTPTWLYVASFLCGFVLAMTLEEIRAIFYGVLSMALIAVLVFGGVLIAPALLNRAPFLDIVLLIAFQQSFPRFIFICISGYAGASFQTLLGLFFDRLQERDLWS